MCTLASTALASVTTYTDYRPVVLTTITYMALHIKTIEVRVRKTTKLYSTLTGPLLFVAFRGRLWTVHMAMCTSAGSVCLLPEGLHQGKESP